MIRAASTQDEGRAAATERLGPDAAGIATAAGILAAGGLVAFPTETVYGLGADAASPAAVAALYAAKGRPSFNPLITHVATLSAARREGLLDAGAETLAGAFWPGPLTLVVPAAAGSGVSELARAGLTTVGLRVPSHPLALALLAAVGRPVVAPSANRSGHVSPTTAAHVATDLDGRIDAILDGGATPIGIESTIVACLDGGVRLLRHGGVPLDALERVLGRPLATSGGGPADRPIAPGALASHYAPATPVRLDATSIRPGEAALLFGPDPLPGIDEAVLVLNLSPSGDPTEAAANLFGFLRRLDAAAATAIAVAPIPIRGLGAAIDDRLRRAAAERP